MSLINLEALGIAARLRELGTTGSSVPDAAWDAGGGHGDHNDRNNDRNNLRDHLIQRRFNEKKR